MKRRGSGTSFQKGGVSGFVAIALGALVLVCGVPRASAVRDVDFDSDYALERSMLQNMRRLKKKEVRFPPRNIPEANTYQYIRIPFDSDAFTITGYTPDYLYGTHAPLPSFYALVD